MKFRTLAFVALAVAIAPGAGAAPAPTAQMVVEHYTDLAEAVYGDSLVMARQLQTAVNRLLAEPREQTLAAARAAWRRSRVPYQQSEVYRFGNAVVDDWEGKVNAWPLDEGLIDYVDDRYAASADENPGVRANVIANPMFDFAGQTMDARDINKELLESMHEIGGVEANVTTGYHAIEFLLWGQDLNGTGPGMGDRPASDFDPKNCSNGNCARRAAYLRAATDLLVDDLAWMHAQWQPGGATRASLLEGSAAAGLSTIITGMGSLSYGELAGERMQLGLLLHDPEEEHDCFSDNTHYSHYYDALGIRNIYLGEYRRVDGTVLVGPGIATLVAQTAPAVDAALREQLAATMAAMGEIVRHAEQGEAYDQMFDARNRAGNARVQAAIEALRIQTEGISQAAEALQLAAIEFEGSDSLDNVDAVFE